MELNKILLKCKEITFLVRSLTSFIESKNEIEPLKKDFEVHKLLSKIDRKSSKTFKNDYI